MTSQSRLCYKRKAKFKVLAEFVLRCSIKVLIPAYDEPIQRLICLLANRCRAGLSVRFLLGAKIFFRGVVFHEIHVQTGVGRRRFAAGRRHGPGR
jgi:hypothetical protein